VIRLINRPHHEYERCRREEGLNDVDIGDIRFPHECVIEQHEQHGQQAIPGRSARARILKDRIGGKHGKDALHGVGENVVLQQHRHREHHLAIERPVGVHVEWNPKEPAVSDVQLGNAQVINTGIPLNHRVHAANSSHRKGQHNWQEATGTRSYLSWPASAQESMKVEAARTDEGNRPHY